MMGGRSLGRQLSTGQGKRLSARALLGAFGPMGLSAVLFDLQGKIDADQLQAAQVRQQLMHAKGVCNVYLLTMPQPFFKLVKSTAYLGSLYKIRVAQKQLSTVPQA